MRKKGKIVFWNEEKGFGFVLPSSGKNQIFVHINDFVHSNRKPSLNDEVRYIVSSDKQGRPCGKSLLLTGERAKTTQKNSIFTYIIFLAFVSFAGWSFYNEKMPMLVLLLYFLLSLVTFIVYAIDKSAAKKDKWRTSESTLHMLSIAGGWPGAAFAQKVLRHKNKKQNFRFVFWVTILLNVSLFFLLYMSYDSLDLKVMVERIESFLLDLLP